MTQPTPPPTLNTSFAVGVDETFRHYAASGSDTFCRFHRADDDLVGVYGFRDRDRRSFALPYKRTFRPYKTVGRSHNGGEFRKRLSGGFPRRVFGPLVFLAEYRACNIKPGFVIYNRLKLKTQLLSVVVIVCDTEKLLRYKRL